MSHKNLFKSIHDYALDGSISSLCITTNKFDLTAKFLVTNSVVITRVHCSFWFATLNGKVFFFKILSALKGNDLLLEAISFW